MTPNMTLDDYLSLLWRRKWIILQAAIIVPVVAVVLALRQNPVYQASSQVLISRQDIGSELLGLQNANLYTDPVRFAETQAAIARAPQLAARVLKATKIDETSGALLGSSDVTPSPSADLLNFTVKSGNPDLAAKLATAYGREFTVYRRQLDTAAMQTALTQVQNRLGELRKAGGTSGSEYSRLLTSEQQLKLYVNLQTSNTYLIREAQGAAQIEPQPRHNGMLGLFGGIVLGVCLAFIAEALDKRVRSIEEIETALRLPLLARIPEPSREHRRADEIVMLTQPSSPEAEAFRVLRTNLQFLNVDQQAKLIMITSSVAREGKSTTAASLAISVARAGAKVALVDLDLHNPAIGRFFDVPGRPGFTEAALDLASIDSVVRHVPIAVGAANATQSGNGHGYAKLDVISSGALPLNPGEFVESAAAERVLDKLRERYDFVFIDAPPLLPVSDAISLSAKIDGMIILARLKLVERANLRDVAQILHRCPAAKLGVVITGAPAQTQYYYGSSSTPSPSSSPGEKRRARLAS
jgi:succinoglycan biosynthesis transport protein ExoP